MLGHNEAHVRPWTAEDKNYYEDVSELERRGCQEE